MKELLFEYDMHLDFEPPVEEHRFTLKCIPLSDERQLIKKLDVEVYPKEFLSADEDSFGNYSIYGYTKGKHDRFFARVRGCAQTGLAPSLPAKEAHRIGLFKYQTDYTRPGPAIRAFAERFADAIEKYEKMQQDRPGMSVIDAETALEACRGRSTEGEPSVVGITGGKDSGASDAGVKADSLAGNTGETRERFWKADTEADAAGEGAARDASPGSEIRKPENPELTLAVTMMHGLYENFSYVPGVTDVRTTAEEAMALGRGVCQDYAHILLSLCRMQKIPCRYVVGMLIGEGKSHAWVEVCSGGHWYALDPTNNLIVDDQHIKISAGRDYHDCIVSQGVFVGRTTQTQTVAVRVKEATVL
ncbi:MAG: transglutaminase family protein [Lachnospiraceae bacterium]|nr:transglutaminase family protein [Lachnospiraceae bacterium]